MNREIEVERRAFSIERAANVMDVSVPFIRKEIKLGHLKAIKRGSRILILSEDLDAYLKNENPELLEPAASDPNSGAATSGG